MSVNIHFKNCCLWLRMIYSENIEFLNIYQLSNMAIHTRQPNDFSTKYVLFLPPTYVVRGKVLFSQVSVCLHLRGYLPWMGGGGVPTLDGRGTYLGWERGTLLGWLKGIPTLDGLRGYLPWMGWGGTNLGWGRRYLPWMGREYLPWMGRGTYLEWGGGTYLGWGGGGDAYPLQVMPRTVCLLHSCRRTFLFQYYFIFFTMCKENCSSFVKFKGVE